MPEQPQRTVLERFPAGGPRGSWPADEYAARRQAPGQPALHSDSFLVVADTPTQD
ncbi:hypothetical protein [Streptomyces misionensis]|uniref:hypothetical protein n=1 Tax=Streptomyces misionensis TaxID=67331 RepID=UPI00396BE7AD